ncbi:MAG: HIT family protein [Gammaproteobacteria bacterium]|nr:HIT family protein [Gammaproteobacteria bacterium]
MQQAGAVAGCPLCEAAGGEVLWRDARCRVILADEAAHPAFCRVVWHAHVREMTDLGPAERTHLLGVVLAVEAVLRELLAPAKINLASLGNQVPHLHWHVIPRFIDDAHYPDAVWAAPRREGVAHAVDAGRLRERLAAVIAATVAAQ